jgi:uncharacterized RDD family membrane protein YckC
VTLRGLEREAPPARAPRQQDLFQVIPFDTIAPPRPRGGQGARRPPPRRSASRVVDPNQADLPFAEPVAPAARPAALCQGPVASIRSRSQAGAFDASMVGAGFVLFLLLTSFWESGLPFERSLLWAPVAVLSLILCFYKCSFCLLSDRSPGMRVAGLRLLHVGGRPAGRRERLMRELASLLSLVPGGIGYLWALVDEEDLTFHDHISETFPSPDPPAR